MLAMVSTVNACTITVSYSPSDAGTATLSGTTVTANANSGWRIQGVLVDGVFDSNITSTTTYYSKTLSFTSGTNHNVAVLFYPILTNGINGTNGIDGINGTNGIDGTNGLNGTDGINGKDGIDGKDGINGIDGINGTDGIDGLNGLDGKNGLNGIDGKDGSNGALGLKGDDLSFDWLAMIIGSVGIGTGTVAYYKTRKKQDKTEKSGTKKVHLSSKSSFP